MSRALVFGWSSITLLVCAACGGAPVPHERMAAAEAEMRAAQVAGANDVQQAALHLKMAQDQVDKAKGLIEKNDNEEAALVLDCAQADAQYALTLAKEDSTKKEAEAAAKQVEELKHRAAKQQ